MNGTKAKCVLVAYIKYFAALLIVVAVYVLTNIGCPIYHFLGICCPTCGVTRAFIGLLSGDLEQYFSMNPFAIPLVIAVFVAVHLSTMSVKWKKCGTFYIVLTAVSNFCWYIYRIL